MLNATTSQWVMCRPDYYGIEYIINAWMEGHIGQAHTSTARHQWQELYQILASRTEVRFIPPVKGVPDLCFTANAGLVMDNIFIPSNFRYPERQPEEPIYLSWFRDQGFSIKNIDPGIYFEGEGDALFQPEESLLWLGYQIRTDIAAQQSLETILNVEVIPLRLINPYFYHLDTCFMPLSGGRILYYPSAFDDASLQQIYARVPANNRLAVSTEDANHFSCNAIVCGDAIICNDASPELRAKLQDWGFEVICTPFTEFMLAGGAAKCLVLKLNKRILHA